MTPLPSPAVPLASFLAASGAGVESARAAGWLALAGAAVVGALALVLPRAIPAWLRAAPLADGPVRARLEALAARSGIVLREVLTWRSGRRAQGVAIGWHRRNRRLLVSEGLLQRFDSGDAEAICAHELGHFAGAHQLWALLATIAAVLPLAALERAATALGARIGSPGLEWAAIPLYLAVVWLAVLPRLWRRFELEADAFGAQVAGTERYGDLLRRETAAGALRGGWRHPSPAHRIGVVEGIVHGGAAFLAGFTARGRRVRLAIGLWSAGALAAAVAAVM